MLGIDNFILCVGNRQLIRAVLEVLKQPGGKKQGAAWERNQEMTETWRGHS